MELEMREERCIKEEMEEQTPKKRQKGGIRTLPFILGNEVCDRLAGVGFYANMITYLTQQLNMPLVQASNTLTNFGGTSSFTPLIGALIADSFAGQFWTITFGLIFYLMVSSWSQLYSVTEYARLLACLQFSIASRTNFKRSTKKLHERKLAVAYPLAISIFCTILLSMKTPRPPSVGLLWRGLCIGKPYPYKGMLSLTLSAIIPKFHPPPCPTQVNCQEASNKQLWVLYISLLLTSLGTGGLRPCVVTFAANQFDMTKSGVASRKWNYFNWYYFSMGLATLTALTVIVYIQDNVSWGWGLGIPTIFMGISVISFVIGYPLYYKPKPAGSPLVRMAQVAVAAWKKRKTTMPEDPGLLYENKELDAAISKDGRLLHTQQFMCLDKAAIFTEQEAKDSYPPNPWRLSTVHRVEELKSIIRVLPIWAGGILLVTASSHQGSFVLQQARTMDRHLSPSFQIPPASLSIFSIVTMLTGLGLYEKFFVPFARKFTGNRSGVTCLQRMGIGYVINIIATIVASMIEMKRKTVATQHNLLDKPASVVPISVFWLVPQYCIHGLAEVFMNVGHLEFLYDQAPESMRSTAAALYCLTTSMGNYLGTLVVTLVHDHTGKEHNWLPNRNLNRGRLEYYYLLVTGIQVLNFIYFVVCAMLYKYKPVEQAKETNEEEEEFYTGCPSNVSSDVRRIGDVEFAKNNDRIATYSV